MDFQEKYYPSWLRLRLVQVIFRHGERTPIFTKHIRPTFQPLDNSSLCVEDHVTGVIRGHPSLGSDSTSSIHYVTDGQPIEGCEFGQLTVVGKKSMIGLGAKFRELYVNKLKFLSPTFSNGEVVVQSTQIQRAIESAHYFLTGLFPSTSSFKIGISPEQREILYPSYRCKLLRRLWDEHKKILRTEHDKDVESLREKLRKEFHIPEKDFTHIDEVYDLVSSAKALNVKVPEILTPEVYEQAEKYMVEFWWKPFMTNRKLLRLGIGQVLDKMVMKMEENIETGGIGRPKLFVYSAHDSSVTPILVSLGIFDGKWPAFASNVELELIEANVSNYSGKSKENNKESSQVANATRNMFVRAMYNGQPKEIAGCPKDPTGMMLCPYAKFAEIIQDLRIKRAEYEEECGN